MIRENLINNIVSNIKTGNNKICLNWGTGVGKSKAAILIADKLNSILNKQIRILLIVAENAHKSNWIKEFDKWGFDYKNVTLECYASLKKYENTQYDLIIFDEAHHLKSEKRINTLWSIKSNNIILLSATLPYKTLREIEYIYGEFKLSKIPLKEIINKGILPEPKIYLIPLVLDDTIRDCTIVEEWGKKEKRVIYYTNYNERWAYIKDKKKYPDVKLIISCTQKEKYDYLSNKFDYYKNLYLKTSNEVIKNKWLLIGNQRKIFLGELKSPYAKSLIDKIKDKRFICFCTNIEQSNYLGGENSINSKNPDSLDIINKFNNKEINNLFSVKMVQEGQNLIDIEIGIIIQLDGQERSFIQRFGRTLRSDSPIQFIFYYKNTRDQNYLNKILDEIDSLYIEELEYENLYK